ncbi:hypothetical protein PR048_014836 [Dryococelus australis]|uniref:Uncharacterized protein n=1 Tax=Dryococelus australis TaxID=614101 RepID=A0ABQ9HFI0_9NEOP|nr:hypothetical protein PR048_014836 [Dryococelus australis]
MPTAYTNTLGELCDMRTTKSIRNHRYWHGYESEPRNRARLRVACVMTELAATSFRRATVCPAAFTPEDGTAVECKGGINGCAPGKKPKATSTSPFCENLGNHPGGNQLRFAFVGVGKIPDGSLRTERFTCEEASCLETQRQIERAGETQDLRENPPISGIVLHDSHVRKSGVTPPGIEPGSPRLYTSEAHANVNLSRSLAFLPRKRKNLENTEVKQPLKPRTQSARARKMASLASNMVRSRAPISTRYRILASRQPGPVRSSQSGTITCFHGLAAQPIQRTLASTASPRNLFSVRGLTLYFPRAERPSLSYDNRRWLAPPPSPRFIARLHDNEVLREVSAVRREPLSTSERSASTQFYTTVVTILSQCCFPFCSPSTVTSNSSEAQLKFYFQDIPSPQADKALLSIGNYTKGTMHRIPAHSLKPIPLCDVQLTDTNVPISVTRAEELVTLVVVLIVCSDIGSKSACLPTQKLLRGP